jgi:hypothetical protein
MKYSHPPVNLRLSTSERRTEDLLDRLLLEVKAIALLYGSETELKAKLKGRLTESHDESVRKFVNALQTKRPSQTGRLFVIALGELLMASILVIAGMVVLVQYFVDRASGTISGSPLSPYISFVEFIAGILLMLSAFYALREAAVNLKQAGLAIRSGET